jgi:phosphate starvation-inducible PhoH-like protein
MAKKLVDNHQIEFLPTAYCRGRSLKNAYILIDEAQNLTRKGIKLLLTRIAEGSLMALNGDTDQSDLPNPKDSGFEWALNALAGKDPKIGVAELGMSDIQRHPLIGTILTNLR